MRTLRKANKKIKEIPSRLLEYQLKNNHHNTLLSLYGQWASSSPLILGEQTKSPITVGLCISERVIIRLGPEYFLGIFSF